MERKGGGNIGRGSSCGVKMQHSDYLHLECVHCLQRLY